MKLRLNNVRLSFPSLFSAKAVTAGDEPAFSASFLIDSADPQLAAINAAIDEAAREKWGAKADAQVKTLRAADKVCLHNGDTKAQYDGYAGNWFISARSKTRPLVIDRDKTPLVESDGRPYSGCYVNASIEVYAQDNAYGKRINATLRGVQFFGDGEAFTGSAPASADDFDDVSAGADAEALV